jgi:hypothetical protein
VSHTPSLKPPTTCARRAFVRREQSQLPDLAVEEFFPRHIRASRRRCARRRDCPESSLRPRLARDLQPAIRRHQPLNIVAGAPFFISLPEQLEWTTRPHEPGEPARHVVSLQGTMNLSTPGRTCGATRPAHEAGATCIQSRMRPSSSPREASRCTPASRRSAASSPLAGSSTSLEGTPLQTVNEGDEDLVVYAYGAPPDESADVLPPADWRPPADCPASRHRGHDDAIATKSVGGLAFMRQEVSWRRSNRSSYSPGAGSDVHGRSPLHSSGPGAGRRLSSSWRSGRGCRDGGVTNRVVRSATDGRERRSFAAACTSGC